MDLLYEKLGFSIVHGMTYGTIEGFFSLPFEPIMSRFQKEHLCRNCWDQMLRFLTRMILGN
jgi:hypothetical protein